jgi:hypothetical protein
MDNLEVWKINHKDFFKNDSEGRIKHFLKYAILAPSTHNMQPWLFKIKRNSCVISYDPRLTLPRADKREHDLYISLGCCIENLSIAAQYFGVFDGVKLFPKNGKHAVAEVLFKGLDKRTAKDKKIEKLFFTITKRVNSRGLFQEKPIKSGIVKELAKLNTIDDLRLSFIQSKQDIQKISSLTAEGLKTAYKDPKFRKEMSGWVNSNLSSRNEGIPGYSLRMPLLLSLAFPFLVRNFNIGRRIGQINYISMASSALVTVMFARRDTKENCINTGRLAERMMLYLQSNNIKTSIFVASVEMGELYKEVQKLTGLNLIPLFVFCAGYMSHNQKQTPRHPLELKITS